MSNISVIHNFFTNVKGYSHDVFVQLQQMVTEILEDLFEMKGAFVVTNGMSDTQIYSKSLQDFSKIKVIADLIATFDQSKFFKSVSGPGFTQIDCIRYNKYQIYYARVSDNHAIFILFADSRQSFEDVVHLVTNNLRRKMANLTKTVSMIPNPVVFVDGGEQDESTDKVVNETNDTKFNIPLPGL